jgi:DNA helicase-2/ATP-dependent DNA helicase PcrA
VHKAKGLEFDYVFLLGGEDKSYPFNYIDFYEKEEARRLLYVALTRAKSRLFIIFAATN